MLIHDLLNILFDQANYECLTILKSVNKRKTKYANKYSVSSYYDVVGVDFNYVLKNGLIKVVVNLAHLIDVNGAFATSSLRKQVLVIKYLVSIGANIHSNENYALFCSANYGRTQTVKYLVSVGADVHAMNDRSLRMSAMNGYISTVKYLVSVGADVCACSNHALYMSSKNGHLEVVKYLISVGADIHTGDDKLFNFPIIKDNFGYLLNT